MVKRTKELKAILKAVEEWMKKHNKEVQFIGSFMAFKGKDFEVVDDLVIGYGQKDTIQMDLDEMNKMVKKEKGDFINW